MEFVGLGIGVVGLAGLFSSCIDCIKLVQQGRYLGKDYILLETKFANQKLRLVTWGRACGMMDPEGYDKRLDDEDLRPCIEATLNQLFQLFKDGKQLRKKYGLKQEQGGQSLLAKARPILSSRLDWERSSMTTFSQQFQEFISPTKRTQERAGLRSSARWAIEDKSKFTELVQHLKDLTDDLEGLTRYLDVADRQREMIQYEVESICEIDALENIEEARLGKIDVVSDAASLQLWKLRDQYLTGGETSESVSKIKSDKLSIAPDNEEWDILPGQNESMEVLGDEISYQVLHRVRCANEGAALIFLDQPSYLIGQQHEDQWAFLDPDHPTQEEQTNHLRGRRNIPSLEAYQQHNRKLQFVVLLEYQCCNGLSTPKIPQSLPIGQSIRLLSESLCSALQKLFTKSCDFPLCPDFKVDLEIQAPYTWFYQARAFFLHTDDLNSVYRERTKSFVDVIFGLMETEYSIVDALIARGVISWKYLHYIFLPSSIIFAPSISEDREHDRAYKQMTWPSIIKTRDPEVIELAAKSWEFDGNFQFTDATLSISRSQVCGDEDKEIEIRDLPVFPLRYARDYDKQALRQRGEIFWSCRHSRYISYSGIQDGRFMVDAAMHREMFPDATILGDHDRLSDNLGKKAMARNNPPGGDFVLLLPPTLHGFDVQAQKWSVLSVSNIKPVIWHKHAFDDLIMDDETKKLLKAMVSNRITSEKTQTDIAERKQSGLALLFHGGPGTGKTFAAESIAELIEKPLYRINVANLGVNAAELQSHMRGIVNLRKAWDCVFLLEDADLILEERSRVDLSRNAMVMAFMRFMDELEGILILTSTRVGIVDEAFQSRINLAIHFEKLTPMQRRVIWRKLLLDIERDGAADYKLLECDVNDLAELKINGRQIRNIVSGAQKLASFKKTRLSYDLLQTFFVSSDQFSKYIQDTMGSSDDQIARSKGYRS